MRHLLFLLLLFIVYSGNTAQGSILLPETPKLACLLAVDEDAQLEVDADFDEDGCFVFCNEAPHMRKMVHQQIRTLLSVTEDSFLESPVVFLPRSCRYAQVYNTSALSTWYGFLFRLTPF